ncbi:MAG: biopolymer transporter ExbD [Sandaracinaceae bacterium]|nr:biopolymer transporter ExbD [Sandaracinaceae bacterium]
MAMSTSEQGDDTPLSEINVTPMVDVMLVLLIIFMVAAPMLTTGLDIDLPSAAAPSMPIDPEQVVITVLADGTIHLGEDLVASPAELEAQLRDRGLEEVYVQGDDAVPYGVVVRVLAAVRAAGIGNMGLVTDPLDRADAP